MDILDRLQPVSRAGTPSIIADRLRDLITDGTFPPGMQLLETQLAARLGVSRGPVREAMARLVQEGLCVATPNRGVSVARLSADDITDLYRARGVIEMAAARAIRERDDPAVFERLGALITERADAAERGDRRTSTDADLRFHAALVDAAGSPRLSRMYATLLAEARMCIAAAGPDAYDPAEGMREHRELLQAIRHGGPWDFTRVVEEHMDAAAAVLVAHLGPPKAT